MNIIQSFLEALKENRERKNRNQAFRRSQFQAKVVLEKNKKLLEKMKSKGEK